MLGVDHAAARSADQRARGFLLGATSGRTTLGGEGLQHQDGSSHLVAATIPNCKAYDPAFSAASMAASSAVFAGQAHSPSTNISKLLLSMVMFTVEPGAKG